jgi:hypothetical protein
MSRLLDHIIMLWWCTMTIAASALTLQLSQRAVRDWREGELSALERKTGVVLTQILC